MPLCICHLRDVSVWKVSSSCCGCNATDAAATLTRANGFLIRSQQYVYVSCARTAHKAQVVSSQAHRVCNLQLIVSGCSHTHTQTLSWTSQIHYYYYKQYWRGGALARNAHKHHTRNRRRREHTLLHRCRRRSAACAPLCKRTHAN